MTRNIIKHSDLRTAGYDGGIQLNEAITAKLCAGSDSMIDFRFSDTRYDRDLKSGMSQATVVLAMTSPGLDEKFCNSPVTTKAMRASKYLDAAAACAFAG